MYEKFMFLGIVVFDEVLIIRFVVVGLVVIVFV